jgi:YHS domain-containing protein
MGLRSTILATCLVAVLAGLTAATEWSGDEPSAGREIPAPFAPFEYLIGSWKGMGVPTANKLKGWSETHAWAWRFEKGAPVGLTVTFQGDKVLTRGQLAYDAASKRYTLTGTGTDDKPLTFSGALDASGKQLVLDRVGAAPDGSRQRLTLYPNASFIRYTLRVSEQEPGAPQFKTAIDVGLTKEGEAFAAGGAAADLPKCIVTGGAATITVSYQGKTFPLCCTGCRDEFNDNPEKYIKKAALRAEAAGKAPAKAATSAKDDGAFDGLIDGPKGVSAAASANSKTASKKAPGAQPEAEKEKPATAAGKADDASSRAASLLKLGQNLEKAGKAAGALGYYRQVVKDYPGTASARTAAVRIKALIPK